MQLQIADQLWTPGNIDEWKQIKGAMDCFLKEHSAGKHYRIDHILEREAEGWFRQSGFPGDILKKTAADTIIIRDDHWGFPVELLAMEGHFLGQRYRVFRERCFNKPALKPQSQDAKINGWVSPAANFKIGYRFESGDEAYPFYHYIEQNFPIEMLEPMPTPHVPQVLHISGHFSTGEKEQVIQESLNQQSLLFFNSCRTYEFYDRPEMEMVNHCVLSYFDIPLEHPREVEDFPYLFYRFLLEGEAVAAAWQRARNAVINTRGNLTPLMFTLFTIDPQMQVFINPFAEHHKRVEKQIKAEKNGTALLKNQIPYPLFRFTDTGEKEGTIQTFLNTTDQDIWIHGAKAGIGKTTLLHQVFSLFKYSKFNGPVFISFREDHPFRDMRLPQIKDALRQYLQVPQESNLSGSSGRKYLLLLDAMETNEYLYNHFDSLAEELRDALGSCRLVVASRRPCPSANFLELEMDISGNDINSRNLRSYYGLSENIELPEIPLIYYLYNTFGRSALAHQEMNRSQVFSAFIQYCQEKAFEAQPFQWIAETCQRYLSILAYACFQNSTLTGRSSLLALREYKNQHPQDIDWWLFDKERGHFRDAESIYRLLLSMQIVVERDDCLEFIHDSFFDYLLAYYFFWQGLPPYEESKINELVYSEVPDYMKEMIKSGIYAGNQDASYLRLVLDRLFYIRDYSSIEAILAQKENQDFIQSSKGLWYCLVKGCYFARNRALNIDEIRAFQLVHEFIQPHSLLAGDSLRGEQGRPLQEVCFTLLNILFDYNLLTEFFRLAFCVKETCPSLEIFGLLSRGYLKINQLHTAAEYLTAKEEMIIAGNLARPYHIRLYAEKGLLSYFQYRETADKKYRKQGIAELHKAQDYYSSDSREAWNYLFTLREFLRFYLLIKSPREFVETMQKIARIPLHHHPKTDYVPFLHGLEKIQLENDMVRGVSLLLAGAKEFHGNQLFLEAIAAYLWAYYYSGAEKIKTFCIEMSHQVLEEVEKKRLEIKSWWHPFDDFLKLKEERLLPEFECPFEQVKNLLAGIKENPDHPDIRTVLEQMILIS